MKSRTTPFGFLLTGPGVVIASSGNFSSAAALICRQMSIKCTVVFPLNIYPYYDKIRCFYLDPSAIYLFRSQLRTAVKLGAEVHLEGCCFDLEMKTI